MILKKTGPDCILLICKDQQELLLNKLLLQKLNVACAVIAVDSQFKALHFIRKFAGQGKKDLLILLDNSISMQGGYSFYYDLDELKPSCFEHIYIYLLTRLLKSQVFTESGNQNIYGYIDLPLSSEKIFKVIAQINRS
ncbi:hypothetical protein [Cesiribacter sp. SM1]|uniref:hypothetical protein n=1 Tax=Cesiribacter sp. SM1 TaxID=2861196 RepID=UPI001CD60CBD|nr:hypothetical protein [Cesiribacter sp. SM1]